jgi:hypothetical protein
MRRVRARQRTIVMALTCAVLFLVGCGSDKPTDPGKSACFSTVTISVTPGEQPAFNWVPGCRVHSLSVYPDGGVFPNPIWYVHSVVENGLKPPLVYGQLPEGAHAPSEPYPVRPLEPGQTYTVFLDVRVPDGTDAVKETEVGRANFTQ